MDFADLTFDDPRRFLPYADPDFDLEWKSDDTPAWLTSKNQFPAFSDFCLRQLEELDRRAMAMTGEQFALLVAALSRADFSPAFSRLEEYKQMGMSWEEAERRKRRIAAGQSGKDGATVADPNARRMLPAARAALDMAKIRYVIVPRFWNRTNLPSPFLEEIAAERHDCTPSEARSWFKNNGTPSSWSGQ